MTAETGGNFMHIAIIGGTGELGHGLALRFAAAGHQVLIGSRSAARAITAAEQVNTAVAQGDGPNPARLLTGPAVGMENAQAAAIGDIVVVAVPFEAQESTLAAIREQAAGKVVVEATVPLAPGNPTCVNMPPEGSAAQRAQRMLPESRLVAAFHHVGARSLAKLDRPVETDVLVCGDDPDAKAAVISLCAALGTRGVDCGGLYQAETLERITPLLIGLNIRHRRRHTGVRITGL